MGAHVHTLTFPADGARAIPVYQSKQRLNERGIAREANGCKGSPELTLIQLGFSCNKAETQESNM